MFSYVYYDCARPGPAWRTRVRHATYKLLLRDNGFPIPPEHFVVLRVLEWHRSADRDESVVGIREMRLIIAAKNTSPDAL